MQLRFGAGLSLEPEYDRCAWATVPFPHTQLERRAYPPDSWNDFSRRDALYIGVK